MFIYGNGFYFDRNGAIINKLLYFFVIKKGSRKISKTDQ